MQLCPKETKKSRTLDTSIVVEIKVDTKGDNTANLTGNLPRQSVDALVKVGVKKTQTISDIVDIHLNLDTPREIQGQAETDVSVTAKKVDNSILSSKAKKIVGGRPIYDFTITDKNGLKVAGFGKGKVSVSIPYTLEKGGVTANVLACDIDSTGKVTEMPNLVYDPVSKTLGFVADHFAKFAVGYKEINTKFTDITNHWAKESIEFVAARGLLNGTAATIFSPANSMTHGMFVSALVRLAGAYIRQHKANSFSDVKNDTYYMDFVEWAAKNNIVSGIGDGKFAPDRSISQKLFIASKTRWVLMRRVLRHLGAKRKCGIRFHFK